MKLWAIIISLFCHFYFIEFGYSQQTKTADTTWRRLEYKSRHMGTEWRIVLYSAKDKTGAADLAAKAAFDRVAELEKVMSDYDEKSELMRLCIKNDSAPGKPIEVSGDLFDVLTQGQQIAALSDGSFDMTIGPLVKFWRIAKKTKELPGEAELARAKELVGYQMLVMDAKTRSVTLARSGMRLDLGGIGKGFAADAALVVLKDRGFAKALIAASGDITVGDAPPDRAYWIVDIAPLSPKASARQIKLVNASVSTSGDLFQFVEIGGARYSHVLDPKTGLGLTGRRSATVVAKGGWRADALTKAASVLRPEKAAALIEKFDSAAMYLVVKENDDVKEVVTRSKTFADYEVKDE